MRSTSAPMSESIIAVNGPGPMPANSRMRIPVRGPIGVASVRRKRIISQPAIACALRERGQQRVQLRARLGVLGAGRGVGHDPAARVQVHAAARARTRCGSPRRGRRRRARRDSRARRSRSRAARVSSRSSTRIAAIFGAPVIEPGGNAAATASSASHSGAQPSRDRRHELEHRRVGLDREQLGNGDAARPRTRGRDHCARGRRS